MSRWLRSGGFVLLLTALSGGCVGTEPSADVGGSTSDGHQRMLQLLQRIEQEIEDDHSVIDVHSPAEQAFAGEAILRRLEAELGEVYSSNDLLRFQLLSSVGLQKVRLGQFDPAIEDLQAAYGLSRAGSLLTEEQQQQAIINLAVANLRLGETTNCIHCATGESCIMPIRGKGVHADQRGSRETIKYLKDLLERNPDDSTARWLLNIAYMTLGEYPQGVDPQLLIPPTAFESDELFPRFPNTAAERGLALVSCSGGVVVDDFDNDGHLDVMVSEWHADGQLRVFRNRGDGAFTERTSEAGLIGLYGGLNMVQADYDNDGDVDVLVLRGAWLDQRGGHPNSLLRNDGRGNFRDVTFEAGLGEVHYPSQTAAWADYDNDGDLDLFVGNERSPCQLFNNDGHGRFTNVAPAAGVENNRYTKGAIWGDYNGDRLPDLYVSNLMSENRLYHNRGDGTFEDVAPQVGVTRPIASFPVWFWDFNNDGALDLFVFSYMNSIKNTLADYLGLPHQDEPDCLYQGDGRGSFTEVSKVVGLTRVTLPMGANFGDLDHDGFPDFYLGTGWFGFEAVMPNLMFHNKGGKRFVDVTGAGRFGHLQKGHGVAFADLDSDGDQDVFIRMGGAYKGDAAVDALFENPGFSNHWIGVKLIGTESNRSAIGARIRVEIDDGGTRRNVFNWVNSGGSFGANPLRQQIGLGQAKKIDLLEIYWPTSDRYQRFQGVAVDQFLEIREGEREYRIMALSHR